MTAPAFPHKRIHRDSQGIDHEVYCPGLTKREYAAIHIAAAIAGRTMTFGVDRLAQEAVALADAVLREAGE